MPHSLFSILNYLINMECEKCGGEMGLKFAGDESYYKCDDCGHIDLS